MADVVEVRVAGRGSVRDGVKKEDASTIARCDLCGGQSDAVVSTAPGGAGPFACKSCLRARLEAITVATWVLRRDTSSGGGLPWGKISG